MELKDLKSAWSKYASTEASRHRLNEADLHDLLKKRTKGLIERIDRNIKIGFAFLLLLTLFFVTDDFVLTPLLSDGLKVPGWILLIDGLNTLFILGTFAYFSLSYYAVKRNYSQGNDLRQVLKSIIHILNTYRKLFYLALGILLLVFSVGFITGMFFGVEIAAHRQGVAVEDLNQAQMTRQMVFGLLILLSIITGLFFLFRMGFRKLYGKYILQLEETLNELEEMA
ncbi:hypothetical protein [Gaoshiqia sediminis]|uniref:Uncharacterized protein n=1 Tax=Gaoshiqia sediminis TaxID=2986998 RepID=A0AA41Y547_9BACT|nr:hypothetical protein [Gaoshiqia sediminis]MCW0483621.1 hypothetical protein [Gaoshiqia sediminis]